MNIIKLVVTGTAALGMIFAGTAANAEAVRSSASMPGVVGAKKIGPKTKRTVAPTEGESNVTSYASYGLAVLAAIAAGYAVYEIVDDGNNGFVVSPGT